MLEKVLLILALHAGATFDAWSTNERATGLPPGIADHERHPLIKPGGANPYVVLNLQAVAFDVWILSSKKPKAARWTATAFVGAQTYYARRNFAIKSNWRSEYEAHRAFYGERWDGVYRDCPFARQVIANPGCTPIGW